MTKDFDNHTYENIITQGLATFVIDYHYDNVKNELLLDLTQNPGTKNYKYAVRFINVSGFSVNEDKDNTVYDKTALQSIIGVDNSYENSKIQKVIITLDDIELHFNTDSPPILEKSM